MFGGMRAGSHLGSAVVSLCGEECDQALTLFGGDVVLREQISDSILGYRHGEFTPTAFGLGDVAESHRRTESSPVLCRLR